LEVAVLVEVRDEHRGDALVALREAGERELLQQVLLQRRRGGGELREVLALLVVVARAAAARRRIVAEAAMVVERGLGLAGLLGARRLGRGRRPGAVHRRRRFLAARGIDALEERIVREVALKLLVQLDRGQLQQSDRLLELRREREMLR